MKKKKKTSVTVSNPTGQLPKKTGNIRDGHASRKITRTPKGLPVKNYST